MLTLTIQPKTDDIDLYDRQGNFIGKITLHEISTFDGNRRVPVPSARAMVGLALPKSVDIRRGTQKVEPQLVDVAKLQAEVQRLTEELAAAREQVTKLTGSVTFLQKRGTQLYDRPGVI